MPEIKLNVFLGLILIMGYLNYPIRKGTAKVNSLPWYDILIMLAGAIPFFYFAANATPIIKLATRVTKDQKMVVMAVVAVLAYMELCRRSAAASAFRSSAWSAACWSTPSPMCVSEK